MTTDSVFISYSNADVSFANEIADYLIKANVNVWIDTINGKDDDAIQKAIKSAKHVLIVTSNNAFSDESLKQEKDYARKNNIDRTLVKIEPCDTDDKMRWGSLACIDMSIDKQRGLDLLVEKFGGERLEAPENTEDEIAPTTPTPDPIPAPEPAPTPVVNDTEDLSRKASLLVSEDDINGVRAIVENRLRSAKNQTYIYIAGAVGLIVLVLSNGTFQEMFTSGKDQIDGALGFIEKFYPGITAALPTVISGGAFKKVKEHKQSIVLVDQIKNKRDRIKKAIDSFSEPEIMKLEEDLEKLIKF